MAHVLWLKSTSFGQSYPVLKLISEVFHVCHQSFSTKGNAWAACTHCLCSGVWDEDIQIPGGWQFVSGQTVWRLPQGLTTLSSTDLPSFLLFPHPTSAWSRQKVSLSLPHVSFETLLPSPPQHALRQAPFTYPSSLPPSLWSHQLVPLS